MEELLAGLGAGGGLGQLEALVEQLRDADPDLFEQAEREARREAGVPEDMPRVGEMLRGMGGAGGEGRARRRAGGGGNAAGGRFRRGNRVTVRQGLELNRRLAEGHGGWVSDMARYLGRSGEVQRVDGDGDVSVVFDDGRRFTWNPEALLSAAEGAMDTSWHSGLQLPPPYAPWRLEHCRLRYQGELERLADMGFPEVRAGIRALMKHDGDVDMAAAMIESGTMAAAEARASPAGDPDAVRSAPRVKPELVQTESESEPEPESDLLEADGQAARDAEIWFHGLVLAPGDPAPPPLCDAVLAGDTDLVRRFLAEPGTTGHLWFVTPDVEKRGTFDLLRVAAVEGYVEICELLLDAGAEVELVVAGATALMLAAWAGKAEVVRVLHEHGARLDFVSPPIGETVQTWRVSGAGAAVANGTYRPVTLPSYSGVQPFSNGNVTMFRWQQQHWVLADLGPENRDFDQLNWLYSCRSSSATPPTSEWVINQGRAPAPTINAAVETKQSTVDTVGPMGSALWLATLAGNAEVVKYALLHGASLESPGPHNDTALRVAERSTTNALVAALFTGAKFWAQASLKDAKAEVEKDGQPVHESICDRSGAPIVGCLYHLRGFNYDICEAEFAKLSEAEKEKYEAIPKPPRQLFQAGELLQLCESQERREICDLLSLVEESQRVRARQRLAFATLLIDEECHLHDCTDVGVDVPARICEQLSMLPKSSADFNLKVIREESQSIGGVSKENLKRLRSVERQLMPAGSAEIVVMLETAGILDVHAAGTLMAAVERSAHGQRDPLEGIYKCLQKNGVGIRAQPQESTKRLHGPAYGALIAVEGVRVCKAQLAQPEVTESKAVQRDIDAALQQLQASMGVDIAHDVTRGIDHLGPVEKLVALQKIMPLKLPSQQSSNRSSAAAEHEITYLKLVGGGYCPMQLPSKNNAFFARQSSLVPDGVDPMSSPALAICAARSVAAGERCDGVSPCEWLRFRRFALAWPGRPQRLAPLEAFPTQLAEQKSLEGFLKASKLIEYAEPLQTMLGLELSDVPFLLDEDLQRVVPKFGHHKRFRRFGKVLPVLPEVVTSYADAAYLTKVFDGGTPRVASSHLLGDSVADEHFRRNAVHFRRIRQLADGVSDDIERDRRRRGKFCGKFCDGGEMAEKDKVREHGRAHDALTRGNMDVFAKVEQMWAGERSLQVLQHGLSPDARRLIELILHAEDDVFDTEVTRELHDEPNNAGDAESARRFFESNMVHLVRIRQLADPARAMSTQPRFNQNGVEDERSIVREHYCPTWKQFGWDIAKPIERLWAGERDLQVLARGCDPGCRALVEILLNADEQHAEEALTRHRQRRGSDGAIRRAEALFDRDKVSFRRIRQLADPVAAMTQQPRFNQRGIEAERQEVRDRLFPRWVATGWQIVEPIERLWRGEEDLERVREGCDPAESRLLELILTAHQDHRPDRDRQSDRQEDQQGVDTVDPRDPLVLQAVDCGFTEQRARMAVYVARKQGLTVGVDAVVNFMIEHPQAGVPPTLVGPGHVVCPDGHRMENAPRARHDTFCDVCGRSPIHHICQRERHYDVCATCYADVLAGDKRQEDSQPVQEGVAQVVEEGFPPDATGEPPAAQAPADTTPLTQPTQDELRRRRLARFGQ